MSKRRKLIEYGKFKSSVLCAWIKKKRGHAVRSGERPLMVAASLVAEEKGFALPRNKAEARSILWKHRGEIEIVVPENKKPTKRQGGYAASDKFLQSYEWRKLRMEALKLHGARCQCCGASPATGAVMNVDHIKPRRTHPELALTLSNLQVLCGECNHGKGNWDQTDWRPKT